MYRSSNMPLNKWKGALIQLPYTLGTMIKWGSKVRLLVVVVVAFPPPPDQPDLVSAFGEHNQSVSTCRRYRT